MIIPERELNIYQVHYTTYSYIFCNLLIFFFILILFFHFSSKYREQYDTCVFYMSFSTQFVVISLLLLLLLLVFLFLLILFHSCLYLYLFNNIIFSFPYLNVRYELEYSTCARRTIETRKFTLGLLRIGLHF